MYRAPLMHMSKHFISGALVAHLRINPCSPPTVIHYHSPPPRSPSLSSPSRACPPPSYACLCRLFGPYPTHRPWTQLYLDQHSWCPAKYRRRALRLQGRRTRQTNGATRKRDRKEDVSTLLNDASRLNPHTRSISIQTFSADA